MSHDYDSPWHGFVKHVPEYDHQQVSLDLKQMTCELLDLTSSFKKVQFKPEAIPI